MPKIALNRRGSRSVANIEPIGLDSSLDSNEQTRLNSDSKVEQHQMITTTKVTTSAQLVTARPAKKGVPRLVKSDKPKKLQDTNRISSGSSKGSSGSRIPVLKKRKGSANLGAHNTAKVAAK